MAGVYHKRLSFVFTPGLMGNLLLLNDACIGKQVNINLNYPSRLGTNKMFRLSKGPNEERAVLELETILLDASRSTE